MPVTNSHLSDADFTELLLGSIPAHVAAHLNACSGCAEEARRVSNAIGGFERQSRVWAERRAATQQSVQASPRNPILAWLQRPVGIATWSAATAALLLAATMGLHHLDQPVSQDIPVASVAPAQQQVTPAKLKEDNDLLYAIDDEMKADVSPASAYGLDLSAPAHDRRSKRMSN
jgi:hypothetical protein